MPIKSRRANLHNNDPPIESGGTTTFTFELGGFTMMVLQISNPVLITGSLNGTDFTLMADVAFPTAAGVDIVTIDRPPRYVRVLRSALDSDLYVDAIREIA